MAEYHPMISNCLENVLSQSSLLSKYDLTIQKIIQPPFPPALIDKSWGRDEAPGAGGHGGDGEACHHRPSG